MDFSSDNQTDGTTFKHKAMGNYWRCEFFGGLRVRRDGQEISRFRTQKTAALLALLAMKAAPQRREELCVILWPDAAPEQARNSLSAALSSLRKDLGDEFFYSDRYTIGLASGSFETDVRDFDRALRDGNWAKAVELYRGPFLPGFYEDPLPALAGEYEEKARQAWARRGEQLEQANDWENLLALTRRAITLFGDNTQTFRALMKAHIGHDDKEAALRAYEDWKKWARRENELVPEAARHVARKLRQELSVTPTSNLEVPPQRHAEAQAENQKVLPILDDSSLPMQWTRFFGRESQIGEIGAILRLGERLVTLTGSGGTGKTRLVLEVAKNLADDFDKRVVFVPLAGLSDPSLLLMTVRDALGLPSGSDVPPLQQIAGALRGVRFLLVLDNFEQLVEGGASVLQSLREAIPQAQLLVTSRILLGLPGEREWCVPPLSAVESRELFIDRAGGRWSGPEHAESVDELCRALEDLPLAVELAAARAALLSPSQIYERLTSKLDFLSQRGSNVAPRHRSLRAAIEWSFDLLSDELRGFFLALSTFRDGWTLEAACAVGQVNETQALDWLEQLREHSLIITEQNTEEARFRMLMMLREWAREQLDSAAQGKLNARHFDYYLHFIETRATPQAIASQAPSLVIEVANFRGALAWALASQAPDAASKAARLCSSLFWLWDAFSQFLTGREWVGRTLVKMSEPGQLEVEPKYRAPFLAGGGFAFWYCGEFETARAMLEESIQIAHAIGDGDTEAFALSGLSRVVMTLGEWELACVHGERGLAIARQTKNPARLINCLVATGWAYHNTGRHSQTQAIFKECFQVASAVGSLRVMSLSRGMEAFSLGLEGEAEAGLQIMPDVLKFAEAGGANWFCAFAHAIYGILARECGHLDLARYHSPRAARDFARIGTRWETSSSISDCGMLAVALGDWHRGAHLLAAAEALRESINHPILPSIKDHYMFYKTRLQEALPVDEFEREWQRGRLLSIEAALLQADVLRLDE